MAKPEEEIEPWQDQHEGPEVEPKLGEEDFPGI